MNFQHDGLRPGAGAQRRPAALQIGHRHSQTLCKRILEISKSKLFTRSKYVKSPLCNKARLIILKGHSDRQFLET